MVGFHGVVTLGGRKARVLSVARPGRRLILGGSRGDTHPCSTFATTSSSSFLKHSSSLKPNHLIIYQDPSWKFITISRQILVVPVFYCLIFWVKIQNPFISLVNILIRIISSIARVHIEWTKRCASWGSGGLSDVALSHNLRKRQAHTALAQKYVQCITVCSMSYALGFKCLSLQEHNFITFYNSNKLMYQTCTSVCMDTCIFTLYSTHYHTMRGEGRISLCAWEQILNLDSSFQYPLYCKPSRIFLCLQILSSI